MENLPYIFRQVAYLFAAYARIEAMKAENQWRLQQDESLTYGEDPFMEEAKFIEIIANNLGDLRR